MSIESHSHVEPNGDGIEAEQMHVIFHETACNFWQRVAPLEIRKIKKKERGSRASQTFEQFPRAKQSIQKHAHRTRSQPASQPAAISDCGCPVLALLVSHNECARCVLCAPTAISHHHHMLTSTTIIPTNHTIYHLILPASTSPHHSCCRAIPPHLIHTPVHDIVHQILSAPHT